MAKILIVDDDPLIRNLLGQVLEAFEDKGVKLLDAEMELSPLKQPKMKGRISSFWTS
jgi:nucleoside diphosphate kinase